MGLAVAGSLLWWAASRVPWTDEMTLHVAGAGGESTELVLEGKLRGDWRSEWTIFDLEVGSLAADSSLGGTLLADALRSGGAVYANRGGLAEVDRQQPDLVPVQPGLALPVTLRPGMPNAFRHLDPLGITRAFGFVLLCVLAIVTRWWRLLAMSGCPTPWITCLRLTFVGLFFNTVLPGSTGGDLARAYVVVRQHPERRSGALVSVIMDRLIGLVAMALLASAAVATADERFAFLLPWTVGAALAMITGLVAFAHGGLRRLLRVERLLSKMPQGRRLLQLDSNIRSILVRPGGLLFALVFSLLNHVSATAAVYYLGRSFGSELSFHDFLCVCTVANTLPAVPISPGGLGVGEVLFGSLFERAGSLYMLGVASSFTYRLVMMAAGLMGGLALILPGGGALMAEFRAGQQAAAAGD